MTEKERNKKKQKVMSDSDNIISLYSYLVPPLERIIKQTSQEEIQQTCSEAIHLQSGLKEFIKSRVMISKSKIPIHTRKWGSMNESYQKQQVTYLDMHKFQILEFSDTKYKVNVL